MPETDPTAVHAAAQERVDTAWNAHEATRGPLRDELRHLLSGIEGVTGLAPGPGADNLIDRFLDFAEYHAEPLASAAQSRSDALAAEEDRNAAQADLPADTPPAVPAVLTSAEPGEVRRWLMNANPNDVRDTLNAVLDRDEQVGWARRLMEWARADGNTAQTFEAINSVIGNYVPTEVPDTPPAQGVGATSTYSEADAATANANPANEPPADAAPDALVAWVGTDVGRARVVYDNENSRAEGARPEVLAALVDVLDSGADVPPAE